MKYVCLLCLTALLAMGLYAQPLQQDMTITESSGSNLLLADESPQSYQFGEISEAMATAIQHDEVSQHTAQQIDARNHIRDVLIGFILEIILTILVLQIAFSLSGFPCLFRQIALFSMAVALVGAALEYLLFISLFNPIRIGLSFIILLLLIRQMTDVREWVTAIRIALLARLISLGLMWASFAGLMVLFGV